MVITSGTKAMTGLALTLFMLGCQSSAHDTNNRSSKTNNSTIESQKESVIVAITTNSIGEKAYGVYRNTASCVDCQWKVTDTNNEPLEFLGQGSDTITITRATKQSSSDGKIIISCQYKIGKLFKKWHSETKTFDTELYAPDPPPDPLPTPPPDPLADCIEDPVPSSEEIQANLNSFIILHNHDDSISYEMMENSVLGVRHWDITDTDNQPLAFYPQEFGRVATLTGVTEQSINTGKIKATCTVIVVRHVNGKDVEKAIIYTREDTIPLVILKKLKIKQEATTARAAWFKNTQSPISDSDIKNNIQTMKLDQATAIDCFNRIKEFNEIQELNNPNPDSQTANTKLVITRLLMAAPIKDQQFEKCYPNNPLGTTLVNTLERALYKEVDNFIGRVQSPTEFSAPPSAANIQIFKTLMMELKIDGPKITLYFDKFKNGKTVDGTVKKVSASRDFLKPILNAWHEEVKRYELDNEFHCHVLLMVINRMAGYMWFPERDF